MGNMHFICTVTSCQVGCGCRVRFIHQCWWVGCEVGKNGKKSKVEIHECVNDQNNKLHVLGGASWGRFPPPPPG